MRLAGQKGMAHGQKGTIKVYQRATNGFDELNNYYHIGHLSD